MNHFTFSSGPSFEDTTFALVFLSFSLCLFAHRSGFIKVIGYVFAGIPVGRCDRAMRMTRQANPDQVETV